MKKSKKDVQVGLVPLTKELLLSRGRCCGNGCLNCPYIPKHTKGSSLFN